MNEPLNSIIDEIDKTFMYATIDLKNSTWRKDIPSEAGWYLIKTDTPISVLKSMESPLYKAHIDIPQTIASTAVLLELGIAIIQSNDEQYVVYNGEAQNLKARAREHEGGHPKTYCLGLSNYPALHMYQWTFCYVAVSNCLSIRNDDKSLRLAIEQGWRAKHGWPILCRK